MADSNEEGEVSSDNSAPGLDEFIDTRRQDRASKPSTEKTPATVEKVNIEAQRERTRTYLAAGLLGSLFISLIGIGFYIFRDTGSQVATDKERVNIHRELITIIWTSQVTLVSGALGFYFASERNNSDNS